MLYFVMRELFLNKMLQKISTDGEVMAKIKVACFFWDTVHTYTHKILSVSARSLQSLYRSGKESERQWTASRDRCTEG